MSFFSRLTSTILTPIRLLSTWFSRTIPGFRRLAQISLPARVAWMFFVFLLIVLGAGIVRYQLAPPDRVEQRNWWIWVMAPLGLIILIPLCVYALIRLLQQKPPGPTDLEKAWQEGVEALGHKRISLKNTPLFLVLGCESAGQARQLADACRLGFSVKPPENSDLPLLWYANPNAIFLFLNGCSSVSALNAKRTADPAARRPDALAAGAAQPNRTIDAAQGDAFAHVANLDPTPPPPVAQPAPDHARGAALATLKPGESPLAMTPSPGSPADRRISPPDLKADELNQRAHDLTHLCEALRKARRPVCGLNGLLVITPFDLIEVASSECQKALLNDLKVVRQRLRVRCPATLVVSEMEKVDGFLELVKRLGEDRAREGRFGKGCQVWGDPREDRLDAVAANAVAAFEDWIYRVFQDPEALRRRYNNRLVSLLCSTRGPFANQIRDYVKKGFGYDPGRQPELGQRQLLFHGCYFAATGSEEDRQAFLRSVFCKAIEHAGELEWAPEARHEDAVWQAWAGVAGLVGTAALIALVGGILMLSRG